MTTVLVVMILAESAVMAVALCAALLALARS